ncbi:MAG: NIPSNAP family protein [Gammaproteobacteria bacterium]|nr:NIPSNAP family protein [Gammaproteobacteria bacterium]
MFQELRQYKIREGKMDAWVEFMETVIIPFQVSKGMVITGSYRGENDDTLYVWTRRFDSEAERERLYDSVYNSDTWRDEIAPMVGELMDGPPVSVQRIVCTPRSPAQ